MNRDCLAKNTARIALVLSDRVAVLRGGRIQQCDAPAEIYAHPADVHVARFVGTPPMNLLPATALADHPALRARLAGREPGQITVGLRPEDVEVSANERPGAVALDVTLLEPAGAHTWALGRIGELRIKGRLSRSEPLAAGARGYFVFSDEALHLFDAASGQRVTATVDHRSGMP